MYFHIHSKRVCLSFTLCSRSQIHAHIIQWHTGAAPYLYGRAGGREFGELDNIREVDADRIECLRLDSDSVLQTLGDWPVT